MFELSHFTGIGIVGINHVGRVMLPMFGLVYGQGTDVAGTRVYILVTLQYFGKSWGFMGIYVFCVVTAWCWS